MRNRKRKREEEPASARARGPASWPSRPPTPARPSAPPAVAATWPRASAARPSSLRPQPLPTDPTRQPFSLFIFSTPTPILPSDRTPTAVAGAGQGSCPGHGPVSPLAHRPRDLRANHPTPQCRSMPTVHHQPSARLPKMELRAPAIKALAPEP